METTQLLVWAFWLGFVHAQHATRSISDKDVVRITAEQHNASGNYKLATDALAKFPLPGSTTSEPAAPATSSKKKRTRKS